MNVDQLRYIDLTMLESFSVSGQYFSKASNYDSRNAGPINRMAIAPDYFGYTITNDGTHLIRFTTHGSPVLTDLGDLVADDAGHLYLITGSNKVCKVNIATRVTCIFLIILPRGFIISAYWIKKITSSAHKSS